MLEKNVPRKGDLIACSDGDLGIVISTQHRDTARGSLDILVNVKWNGSGDCVDLWRSEDFNTSKNMFWIANRA